jgi:RNA-directed DNA polymerase
LTTRLVRHANLRLQMIACVRRTIGKEPEPRVRASPPDSAVRFDLMLEWFEKRKYKHFDLPVGENFAKKAMIPDFVARHPFSPLLHYDKVEKRYKPDGTSGKRKIVEKKRPIKYASHRDACIFSYYAHLLNSALDKYYDYKSIGESIIAYRSLGRGSYDFSAEVYKFASTNSPVVILAFDVTGFFDNLDHLHLKNRIKTILGFSELPADWYAIYRAVTNFHYVEKEELARHPEFSVRIRSPKIKYIATIEDLKSAKIAFRPNPKVEVGERKGIPQG